MPCYAWQNRSMHTAGGSPATPGMASRPSSAILSPGKMILSRPSVQAWRFWKSPKHVAQEIEKEWEIEDFQVRIGIDTGLAALGGQTEAEDTVKGRVVNLAVRIESAAPPGGLLISHNTYRHVRGVFNVDPLEPITAKGFPEPVPVYLVREHQAESFPGADARCGRRRDTHGRP